jgi:hypothetical protein
MSKTKTNTISKVNRKTKNLQKINPTIQTEAQNLNPKTIKKIKRKNAITQKHKKLKKQTNKIDKQPY